VRRRVLSVIKDERVARRILDHLALLSQAPPVGGRIEETERTTPWTGAAQRGSD
jgi:hypothetical protein